MGRMAFVGRLLRKGFGGMLPAVVLAVLLLVAVGNVLGSGISLLERAMHFPAYWAPLGLLLTAGLLWSKRWMLGMVSLAVGLGYGAQVACLWVPPGGQRQAVTAAADTPGWTLLAFNVLKSNRRHAEVLAALRREQADVVYLTEMRPEWFAALAPLEKDYPHRLGKAGHSDWLLSKHPLEDARVVSLTFEAAQAANGAGTPAEPLRAVWNNDELVVATVLLGGRRVRVGGIHPPIPTNGSRIAQQRACATIYRDELRADPQADARLLVGDFNTSCFSPTFRLLLEATGLRDSARGFGYAPTWGPMFQRRQWLPWVGLPIDHVLVSERVRVLHREVGPDLGSDHRWVKVRFVVD